MTRKSAVGVVLFATLMVDAASTQERRMDGNLTVTELRGGLYMFEMEPAGNVGISIGEDGVIIIDNQFAPMTEKIVAAVAELTEKPITYVMNTHWHGDHTGGNENFGNLGVPIIAHDNVRVRMSQKYYNPVFRGTVGPSPEIALPILTFSKSTTFHFNGDTLEVVHAPNAHTDGDALFYFREADVLHMGDTFINRGYPYFDVGTGGTAQGVIDALTLGIEIAGPDTLVIPGHGPITDETQMMALRDMVAEALSRIKPMIEDGMSQAEIVAADPLADLDETWAVGFFGSRDFIGFIYSSETQEE